MFRPGIQVDFSSQSRNSVESGYPSVASLRFVLVTILALCSAALGCRQAAFNEYYVEAMAAEIRDLEDRIYEYDSAYQAVEIENENLRAKFERLRQKLQALEASKGQSSSRPESRSTPNSLQNPMPSLDLSPVEPAYQLGPNETIELVPTTPSTTEIIPAPTPAPSRNFQTEPLVPPSVPPSLASPAPTPWPSAAPTPASPSGSSGSGLPGLPPVNPNGDILPPAASDNPNTTSKPKTGKSSLSDLSQEFTMPPSMIRSAQQPGRPAPNPPSLPPTNPSSIRQGKIVLPLSESKEKLADINFAGEVVKASAEIVRDTKIVEVGFHPTLSRGHNFDGKPGDDGIYIVVVPRNQHGESINEAGALTVIAEETIEGEPHRISAWEFSAKQLEESLEPIGVSQGFHLKLPWKKGPPQGRTIQVFLKFALEDGRTLVNRTEIVLSKPSNRQLQWTPRQ
jgi:hypothetical protein